MLGSGTSPVTNNKLNLNIWKRLFNLERTHLGPGLGHHFANRNVKPGKATTVAGPTEEHVVGEELQLGDVVHLLHAVNLDALVIVDISPFLLSNSKKVLGVQPLDCVDRLARTDLASQSLRLPVKRCDVATPGERDFVKQGVLRVGVGGTAFFKKMNIFIE